MKGSVARSSTMTLMETWAKQDEVEKHVEIAKKKKKEKGKPLHLIQKLQGHSDTVYSLVLLDSDLASGSYDEVRVWAIESGQCLQALASKTYSVFALANLGRKRLACGCFDFKVRVYQGSDCIATLTGHQDSVYALSYLRDGRLASGSWDHSIRIWSIELPPPAGK